MMIEWNNSKISLLQRCGEAFRRRYVEGDIIPPSPRMLRGTVVHSVAKTAMLRKYDHDELPSIEEAKDLAASEFELTWRAGVSLSCEERQVGAGTVSGQSKDFAVDLSAFHVETVAPLITPVAVERRIQIRPKDSDIVIHGTIDLVDGQADGSEVVRDLKTSEKSPTKGTADESQQLSMYGMLRRFETGKMPTRMVLDFLVRTPSRNEKKHIIQETTRSEEDFRAIVARLNVAIEAVKRGIFVPANQSDWWCSREWCGYFDSCPYVIKGLRRPAQ